MTRAAQKRLKHSVDQRLRTLRDGLGPELRAACQALYTRRHLLSDDAQTYFSPLAQPVFQIGGWVAELAPTPLDPAALDDLGEASIVGYLHVRVHDDWFDEGVGDPSLALLLAQRFLARHTALLGVHVGSHAGFWELFEHTWRRYAEAMLLERELLRPEATYGSTQFDAILDRSQPLVLPGAAVLAKIGRWDAIAALERFVRLGTRSAQLFNDVQDVEEDVVRGQHTWVARRLGSRDGAAAVRRQLVASGGLDSILAEASELMVEAEEIACELGMSEAAAWCAARRCALAAYQERFYRRLFEQLLSGPGTG